MIKRRIKIVLFILGVFILGVCVYFKSTERSRFAIKAFETLINVPATGLEANEKQLKKIIKYADKLEEKGDLESIRLCFGLRDAVMITLFTEKQKATKVHFGYSLSEKDSISTNFNKDVFLELCEMNRFNETKLIERLPIETNSVISNLFAANITVCDILSSTNFFYKNSINQGCRENLVHDLYARLRDLQTDVCMLTLNPIMKTSDEQFAQTLNIIQNFRDLYIHAEVYKKYGFLWDSKQIKKNIAEIIQERGIVKRVDTFRLEKSSHIYYMLSWYNNVSSQKGRVQICLEPSVKYLYFFPSSSRESIRKQRKWREEKKTNE